MAHLQIIKDLAVEAGQKIMEVYQLPDFSAVTETKHDQSPLTVADKAAHEVIVRGLTKHFPDIPVWSEEGRTLPYEERRHWERFWLVDPLDGTKEFLKRNGEFTVNIALIEGTRPVSGVIYVPVTGVLYFGERNAGAFTQLPGGEPRPIRVSGDTPERIAVGSRSHASPEEAAILREYRVTDHIAIGSSLKFCLIAEGKANFYYRSGPTMEWDTAAGQAIVEAAGGCVTGSNGDYLTYNKPSPLNSSFICTGFFSVRAQ
ncbi:MAG: 3'(2'),5'-bisphosphate nucleotidase [uncultured Cytophagales bacterium]|uniref:3'(2'),5'-bisphosphate nucleotidase CysQ n=1 Tax=uncultured Cytophagales bacterium TaxID=158755 RepID=A0A6J4K8P1_9SPHI|nr:MAG: 3'(2'),5'-bisphosphate nucleotidase [uncultured Cytophagales bacterium]